MLLKLFESLQNFLFCKSSATEMGFSLIRDNSRRTFLNIAIFLKVYASFLKKSYSNIDWSITVPENLQFNKYM